ncbi:uncharacterized protein LOC133181034 [Saccostrea echinata]|uniref:uncharacterized protein LOC133181034 n=1 Tax=Saccostrea echinata TaxID=191078 RepID=UPI002A81A9E5|nr:uncharacterized protein LOC133181034 [Saccostrea echinata]
MTSKISLQSDTEIQLINSTTFRNKNKLKSPERLLHKQRRESSSSTSSSTTSSGSSEHSLSGGDEPDSSIQLCEVCDLDRTLFIIVTIPPPRKHRGEYYHVVSHVTEETSEIKRYDRIIRINSNDVKNTGPQALRDILQTELSSPKKCVKYRNRTTLTLWRWSRKDISEICVQLSFKTKKQVPKATFSYQPTRKHGKLRMHGKVIDKLIQVEAISGTYVRFQPHTGTLIGATINKDDDLKYYLFSFQFYFCTVKWAKQTVTREVCTISCRADDQAYDVIGDLDNKELILMAQRPISIEDPDERFFIFYEIEETEDNVFELLLYENQCVKYSGAEKRLKLEELGMSKSKSKRSFIRPVPQFRFDLPQTFLERTRNFGMRHKCGLCCLCSPTDENIHVTYLDGIGSCNEFKLESEDDVRRLMEDGNGDEIDACIHVSHTPMAIDI